MAVFVTAVRSIVFLAGISTAAMAQAAPAARGAWLEFPDTGVRVEENGAARLSGTPPMYARIHLRRQTSDVSYGSISTRVNSVVANIAGGSRSDAEGIITEVDFANNDALRLRPGRNSIEVIFHDRRNRTYYLSFLLELPGARAVSATVPAAVGHKYGQRHALVIGVSRYQREDAGLRPLGYAAIDAASFGKVLAQAAGANIPPANVHVLTDDDATLAHIKSAIESLRAQLHPDDVLLVYLNLHGAPDPANPSRKYLMAYDSDPADMASTALETTELAALLSGTFPTRRVVLLADTCHSRSLQEKGAVSSAANLVNQYLARAAHAAGFASLEASDLGQISAEGQPWHEHGAFTYYLSKGITGEADTNHDGTVTAMELFSYVRKHVTYDTNDAQLPIAELGAVGDIPLGGMLTARHAASSSGR